MSDLHVLRVFCDEQGRHGNPLGVVLDGPAVRDGDRQAVAAGLGFSETVFVDDAATGRVRIFTPASELPLAGHPLVGAAWLLGVSELHPPAGPVRSRREGDLTWIRAPVAACPPWTPHQLADGDTVAAMTGPEHPDQDADQFWAWQDEAAGLVRARVFARRYGIHEDEATGSASMLLAHRLQRPLTILQGEGSVVHARPGPEGFADVGGLVVLDEVRELS